jgi:aspartate/glutamate racemase
MSQNPRIVLLHATPVAVEPVKTAFAALWPEAEVVNLLDDSLSGDRARDPDLTPAMIDRFVALGRYGASLNAAGLLITCSAFGPAIERLAAETPMPVLKPNEVMFEAAIANGNRIGMLATFAPSVGTMAAEFEEYAQRAGSDARLTTVVVDGAMDALRQGDAATHNRLLAAHADGLGDVDTIMLAHFSTSRAADAVSAAVSVPVLSAPNAAVTRMRALVEAAGKAQ